jgi:hypothetical protein
MMVYIQKVESSVQIADWCAPWKISIGVENLRFVGTAILRGLPLIPRQGKHMSLPISSVPYGGLV